MGLKRLEGKDTHLYSSHYPLIYSHFSWKKNILFWILKLKLILGSKGYCHY